MNHYIPAYDTFTHMANVVMNILKIEAEGEAQEVEAKKAPNYIKMGIESVVFILST